MIAVFSAGGAVGVVLIGVDGLWVGVLVYASCTLRTAPVSCQNRQYLQTRTSPFRDHTGLQPARPIPA